MEIREDRKHKELLKNKTEFKDSVLKMNSLLE
jgi:hypothetical protein